MKKVKPARGKVSRETALWNALLATSCGPWTDAENLVFDSLFPWRRGEREPVELTPDRYPLFSGDPHAATQRHLTLVAQELERHVGFAGGPLKARLAQARPKLRCYTSALKEVGAEGLLLAAAVRSAWHFANQYSRLEVELPVDGWIARPERRNWSSSWLEVCCLENPSVSPAVLDELLALADQKPIHKGSRRSGVFGARILTQLARLEGASSPRSRKRTSILRSLLAEHERRDIFREETAEIRRAQNYLSSAKQKDTAKTKLINFDIVPAVAAKSSPSAKQVVRPRGSRSKYLELGVLKEGAELAAKLFGPAVSEQLALQELHMAGLLLLESRPMSWAKAARMVDKYSPRATQLGARLVLASHSVADVEPEQREVHRAQKASDDDDAYRSWIAGKIARNREQLDADLELLEETATGAARDKKRPPQKTPQLSEEAHLVAIAGNNALLPILYGLGGSDDSPDFVTQAIVLGRWSREYGASVSALSRDSIVLDLRQPPKKAEAIAWAGVARYFYCSALVNAAEGARSATRSKWRFSWS